MQETHNLIWTLSYILCFFNSRVFESAALDRLLAVVGCCLLGSGLWLFVRHLRSGRVRRHRFGRFVMALTFDLVAPLFLIFAAAVGLHWI